MLKWMKLSILCAVFGFTLPFSILSPGAARGSTADLPEGEGKDLVVATCLQCHKDKVITSQHKDATAWKRTVHDMVAKGAQLFPEEIDVVVNYLAKNFGPAEGKRKSR